MDDLDWQALDGLLSPAEYFYLQLLTACSQRGLLPIVRLELAAQFGPGRRVRDLPDDELKWLNGRLLRVLRRRGVS